MLKDTQRLGTEELFGRFSTFESVMRAEAGYEYLWRWPAEIGAGYFSMTRFRPGLTLAVGNYHLFKDIEVDFLSRNPFWSLVFNVGIEPGKSPPAASGPHWTYRPGHVSIICQPECRGTLCLPACAHIKTVSIYLDPAQLEDFLDQRDGFAPSPPHCADSGFHSHTVEMTPNIVTSINQILSCPYKDAMRRMYMESKTLEVLTYSLSQFFSPESVWNNRDENFSDYEVKQVYLAKKRIEQDLQNPPKLLDLAREVGLTHTKLNHCFRAIFNTTMFGYLRELRLNRAKSLLDNGRMNVTEVASEVGYSSLSHFAKSFKEFHGHLPSARIHK